MRKGFTLLEVMTATTILGFVVLGSLGLLTTSLKSFRRTTTDANLTSTNARAVRRICENLRSALSVTVSDNGKRIDYVLPKVSTTKDATTGEYELTVPVVGDGKARAYVVDFDKGTVTDTVTGTAILKGLAKTDPDKQSTSYGQAYVPFLVGTVGSIHSVTVNFVTFERIIDDNRYTRFKTTIVAHNAK